MTSSVSVNLRERVLFPVLINMNLLKNKHLLLKTFVLYTKVLLKGTAADQILPVLYQEHRVSVGGWTRRNSTDTTQQATRNT